MTVFVERPRTACALSGALAAISAMPGVVPIIHSAIGCGASLSTSASFGAGYFGSGYCSGASAPSSAITESDIVFGGNERLREEITSALELIKADLYVVATSCMTEMIGDDVFGAVSEFASDGKPVIAINTPSFRGDSYVGYEIILDGVFNDYLPVSEERDAGLVNIFGIVPAYDPFFRGDLEELSRLVSSLGLRANTFFTPDQTFENVKSAPRAALNIVFSRVWGTGFARRFEEKHGTPFWETDLPVGAEAADRFLDELGRRMGVSNTVTQAVIERENQEYYGYFERAADLFCDSDFKFYAVTATNSSYAIPASSFLQKELGWVTLESFVTDVLKDEQKQALKKAHEDAGLDSTLIFETDASRIARTITRNLPENRGQKYFDDYSPLYILGSSLEKSTAAKRGASQLSISYPVYNRVILDRGYAGYRGGLHLFEDLIDVLVYAK
jgi:nitrogenase molybdenum-iron protein beta chain